MVQHLDVHTAMQRLRGVVERTPLVLNRALSKHYQCSLYLKREDLQIVRSYKLRGAYNMMSTLTPDELDRGVVCASAGNHAQGFAYSCKALGAHGVIFMPTITPKQKIRQTAMFGEHAITIHLVGDTFDDCARAAKAFTEEHGMTFIPPFDHHRIIEGQATVGMEILEDFPDTHGTIDMIILPVGGGGLSAGVGAYCKQYSPHTSIIGVEPEGAPSMVRALQEGHPIMLDSIDRFVDGAAVKRVGDITFAYCRTALDTMLTIPEGKVCSTILQLYNEHAIVVEPAGALSVAALDGLADKIRGKKIVCVLSGGNNDIDRMPEIKERSLQYEGLKHYFLINFAQRPGALKEFVSNVLCPTDDITRFEYMQKTNKESGPALVGIELQHRSHYDQLLERIHQHNIQAVAINTDDKLFGYLI
jgi:threonine dehydratase